jgi:hypothetical protein
VEKIRILAEACEDLSKRFPGEEPFLTEAYVFGDVLRGADPLESVEVALVLNLPPSEVVWETTPRGTLWLADHLRLSKGGFAYFWRSHLDPVANHYIREPVRFWSLDGQDQDVLQALAERRLGDLPRVTSVPETQREQIAGELEVALSRLRSVHASYWDYDWRRENRRGGRYPEHELWEAVEGYLDLLDAGEEVLHWVVLPRRRSRARRGGSATGDRRGRRAARPGGENCWTGWWTTWP